MKAVILAGGSGERFWPLSTRAFPKQFLRLFDDKTLLRQTFERVSERFAPSDILIITSSEHMDLTIKDIPEIPGENIIGEPQRRNTAAACMLGALVSERDEVNMVLPADHRIPSTEGFWKACDTALEGIGKFGGLYTFGIRPTRPDTGYGYIRSADEVINGLYKVSTFKEKPDKRSALEYVSSGKYLWNSGMFLWKAGDLIDEMRSCSPDIETIMRDLDPFDPASMEKIYPDIPKRSIDHAVMELSRNVFMVEGKFRWSDVGSWDSIRELEGGSAENEGISLVNCENVLVRSKMERPIGVVGVSDITIVDTPEGLLVCKEGEAQKVRDLARKFI